VCIHNGRTLRYVNAAAARVLAADSPTEIVGRALSDFVPVSSQAKVHERLSALAVDGDASEPSEVTLLRADGAPIRVSASAVARTCHGERIYEVVFGDVPGERGRQRMHAVLDLVHDGIVIMDSDGRIEFTNKAARVLLGGTAEDLVGLHHSNSAVDLPLYDARGEQISTDSHPIRFIRETGLSLGGEVVGIDRLDGARMWITGHGCLIEPGDPENSSVLFSFTDITEHYDARARLLHDATHDGLTGLPNRVHALNQAARAMAETGARRLSAVLFIDLDRLKSVNDRYGHPTGDEVLRIAAQRMRSATRSHDVVARIGGDEFVALLMGPVSGDEVDAVVRRMQEVLADEVVVGSLTLQIGASIGTTTVAADDQRTFAEVLRDADAAMYRAKAQGSSGRAGIAHNRSDGG
jgi:diguanylate cyclase (GGDEF)-like protein/PAS domain S-box-containing protein